MFNFLLFKKRRHIIGVLLNQLKVPFTYNYLKEQVDLHPSKGSLYCISDMLYQYNVPNVSLKIENDDITKLEPPFLVQLNHRTHHEFVVVTAVKPNLVEYISALGSKIEVVLEQFNNLWTGITLISEATPESREPDLALNRRKQFFAVLRYPSIIASVLCLIGWFAATNVFKATLPVFGYATLLSLFILGCVVSILLMIQSIDKANPFVNKLCALANTNSHCNDVLESPAAKFFGIISWSEVGFTYFAGSLLSLLLIPCSSNILFYINIFALPYTIWSIWYQGWVAKQWCVFCVSIQILLWLTFLAQWASGATFSVIALLSTPIETMLYLFASFLAPAIALWFVLPFVKKAQTLLPAMQKLNRIKANDSIFEAVLKTQKKVEIEGLAKSIAFGNPQAPFVIAMVTNPFCGPCAEMHRKLETLLDQYGDFLQIITIYSVLSHKLDDDERVKEIKENRNRAIRLLTGIYIEYGMEKAQQIYKEWYNGGKNNIDAFLAQYPISGNEDKVSEIMDMHNDWCRTINIEATPSLYVNGFELPAWYNVDDLKYFIRQ